MSKLNRLNEKIWQFFSSVDLAVALFIVISIGAAIGTVIPQRSEPEIVIKFFSKFLPMNLSLNLYEIVSLLDLNNVYHSWWFTFLLFMFALNLVVCSIDRLPNLLKSIKKPTQPYPESFLRSISTKREFIYKSKRQEILEKMLNLLKHNKFSTTLFETSQGIQIYCSRWSKSRLAVYLTHFSILIILAGALVGTFFGLRGYINIVEGTSSNLAILDNGRPIYLPFEIACDKFEVEFYENSSVPKAYRSYIRIIEDGKNVKLNNKENFVVEVNEPFTYKNITFYQATYGFQLTEHTLFKFKFLNNEKEYPVNLEFEKKNKLPNTNVYISVIDFSPALGVDEEGRFFTMDSSMINPAALILFEEGNRKFHKWILARVPESWQTPYGQLKLTEVWGAQFTGLQFKKDPGVIL
ncbi:MAG: cytochrome c biogenesis protein ResB, partial [Thermodesulfovibrionaceae bacterium]